MRPFARLRPISPALGLRDEHPSSRGPAYNSQAASALPSSERAADPAVVGIGPEQTQQLVPADEPPVAFRARYVRRVRRLGWERTERIGAPPIPRRSTRAENAELDHSLTAAERITWAGRFTGRSRLGDAADPLCNVSSRSPVRQSTGCTSAPAVGAFPEGGGS
jgi:hypothetical protein